MLFRPDPARRAAELAYSRVVSHARDPAFFAGCGVPDTVDGRFELICLHAFLYLRRLKREHPSGEAVAQRFVDLMFDDMDRSLREMGTGDLSVGKQVKRMAQALYGRINAYEQGLLATDAQLTEALSRNLYGTVAASAPCLSAMAAYVRREATRLDAAPVEDLLAGRVVFGAPIVPQDAAVAEQAR